MRPSTADTTTNSHFNSSVAASLALDDIASAANTTAVAMTARDILPEHRVIPADTTASEIDYAFTLSYEAAGSYRRSLQRDLL